MAASGSYCDTAALRRFVPVHPRRASMEKVVITLAELHDRVAQLLEPFAACDHATPVPVPSARDPEGCNWSIGRWAEDERGCPDCKVLISAGIKELQRRYDID